MPTYDPSQYDPRRSRAIMPDEALRVPVTAVTCLAALLVTIAWHSGADINGLFLTPDFWHGKPWQPFTSIFPHVDVAHIVFNLYWTWVFGTRVEQVYGSLRTAGLYLFLAMSSGLAEFALAQGGVGLSGVGYGLFGFLYVLRNERQIFAEVLHPKTIRVFVIWFFVCIGLTAIKVLAVANIAHGVGALAGIGVGHAVLQQGAKRRMAGAGLAAAFIATLLGASVFRPNVNLVGAEYVDLSIAGYNAQTSGDMASAERYYLASIKVNDSSPETWFDLGLVYHRLKREKEAADAYARACELAPSDKKYRELAYQMNARIGFLAASDLNYKDAATYLERAVRIDSNHKKAWEIYANVLHELGRTADEKHALEKIEKTEAE